MSKLKGQRDKSVESLATNDTPDKAAPLDTILSQSIEALNNATKMLEKAYQEDEELKKLPYKYVIPEMQVDVKMSLSYQEGRGVFASLVGRGKDIQKEMVSNVHLVIKAVPASGDNSKEN